MRSKLTVLVALFVFVLPLRANEKPSEAYQKAEQALQAANNSLRNHVKNIDYPGLQKDAEAFKASFAVMLTYWQEKKVADAVTFIQDGIKGAEALGRGRGGHELQRRAGGTERPGRLEWRGVRGRVVRSSRRLRRLPHGPSPAHAGRHVRDQVGRAFQAR